MMSKTQWCVLLCLFIIYLLVGATIFHKIESEEEFKRITEEQEMRREIEALLRQYMQKDVEHRIFKKLSAYCGKTLEIDMSQLPLERKWDFYHSVFFVITVVSTIGYGNLAPTTMFSRIFMIFYGLIGIPLNGIVMVTLGGFFGRSFTKLYQRWKTAKMQYDTTRLGLISQIILYAVPGFTFFIFLPGGIMVLFEGWPYDVAVYYCFVTLTTIGFGDYVAGVNNVNNFDQFYVSIYKMFLLIWVIGGLGYVVMVLHFITKVLSSKKVQKFEQILSDNIKKTPTKIRHELTSLLQEFLFMRVKRVYKGEFEYIPHHLERSESCPDLSIYRVNSPRMMRKRAYSMCPRTLILQRIQSDTDLQDIDKEMTFKPAENFMQQKDLLLKVVDALSNYESDLEGGGGGGGGYDGFSDAEILATEKYDTQQSQIDMPKRRRALSVFQTPPIRQEEQKEDLTWYGQDASKNWNEYRNRAYSTPLVKDNGGLLAKLRKRLNKSSSNKNLDVEKQDLDQIKEEDSSLKARYIQQTSRGRATIAPSMNQERVLENTSIAEFLRALSTIAVPDDNSSDTGTAPKRKLGTAGLLPPQSSPPPRTRRMSIKPATRVRRASLVPSPRPHHFGRRFSLRPVEDHLVAPPPYSPAIPEEYGSSTPNKGFRRFSAISDVSSTTITEEINKKEEDNK